MTAVHLPTQPASSGVGRGATRRRGRHSSWWVAEGQQRLAHLGRIEKALGNLAGQATVDGGGQSRGQFGPAPADRRRFRLQDHRDPAGPDHAGSRRRTASSGDWIEGTHPFPTTAKRRKYLWPNGIDHSDDRDDPSLVAARRIGVFKRAFQTRRSRMANRSAGGNLASRPRQPQAEFPSFAVARWGWYGRMAGWTDHSHADSSLVCEHY